MDFENLTQSDIMDAINSGNLVGPETDNPNDIFASAIINGETLLGSRTVKKQEAPAVKDVAAQPQAKPATKPATKPDAPEDPVVREARLDSIAKTRTKLDAIPPKNRRMPVPGKTDARNARVPLIDDPDWKKTSAMKLTAGVNNMQDRDDIHAAYKMLNGDVPVDANALRNIYERMSTSKSDGAKYLRQTLGTVFARSTRDFYTSLRTDPSVIRGVSSYGEASRVVIEQMKKAFGGNDGLLEMYIGTQEGQSALDRGVGFVLQAEKEDLSLEKDRTAIDSNKALAEMRRAGGSSPSGYSPQAPIVYGYTTAMDSGKKSESADAINKIRPGAGDTLKVMDDFVSSEDVSSYGNESLVGLREEDIASTVSAIQSLVVRDSATISTKGALETAIIQSFESVYGEIDPGQRGSVLRAVKDHNGGKWVDDIAKGVTDQMNAAYESVSMSHLSHALDFDSSGNATGLSDIYKNRDSGEYGSHLNNAMLTINGMIAKGQLEVGSGEGALDAAIVLATRNMLAETDRVTGSETYYPDTPEGVEGSPDIRLKRVYSELRPYFETALSGQREFAELNESYAGQKYEDITKTAPTEPMRFVEYDGKEIIAPKRLEGILSEIAGSQDTEAQRWLSMSVKRGVLDTSVFNEFIRSRVGENGKVSVLDASVSFSGYDATESEAVKGFYLRANEDTKSAIKTPQVYITGNFTDDFKDLLYAKKDGAIEKLDPTRKKRKELMSASDRIKEFADLLGSDVHNIILRNQPLRSMLTNPDPAERLRGVATLGSMLKFRYAEESAVEVDSAVTDLEKFASLFGYRPDMNTTVADYRLGYHSPRSELIRDKSPEARKSKIVAREDELYSSLANGFSQYTSAKDGRRPSEEDLVWLKSQVDALAGARLERIHSRDGDIGRKGIVQDKFVSDREARLKDFVDSAMELLDSAIVSERSRKSEIRAKAREGSVASSSSPYRFAN